MSNPKFQMVMDPLMQECLEQIQGKNKTDKLRWALCMAAEAGRAERLYADAPLSDLFMATWTRYRNGQENGNKKRKK